VSPMSAKSEIMAELPNRIWTAPVLNTFAIATFTNKHGSVFDADCDFNTFDPNDPKDCPGGQTDP